MVMKDRRWIGRVERYSIEFIYRKRVTTEAIVGRLLVKGAATDASASDKDNPT